MVIMVLMEILYKIVVDRIELEKLLADWSPIDTFPIYLLFPSFLFPALIKNILLKNYCSWIAMKTPPHKLPLHLSSIITTIFLLVLRVWLVSLWHMVGKLRIFFPNSDLYYMWNVLNLYFLFFCLRRLVIINPAVLATMETLIDSLEAA